MRQNDSRTEYSEFRSTLMGLLATCGIILDRSACDAEILNGLALSLKGEGLLPSEIHKPTSLESGFDELKKRVLSILEAYVALPDSFDPSDQLNLVSTLRDALDIFPITSYTPKVDLRV